MQVHPTPRVVHIVFAAALVMVAGTVTRLAPIVAFGGTLLLAVAFGRTRSFLAVSRLRRAGFEMIWSCRNTLRVARGGEIVASCEIRNRSPEVARCVRVRPVASAMLELTLEEREFTLVPGGKQTVAVQISGKRVGRWGVHGIALEVRVGNGLGDGMFEVPLFFANPLGVEVLPAPLAVHIQSPLGGRARRRANVGPRVGGHGEADEMRELRAHAPGDPFKRIAWKASARRGVLLSREMERQEQDVLWVVVDASVEGLIGEPGSAPLDVAIEEAAQVASRALARGAQVGLVVLAGRLRAWVACDSGAKQAVRIAAALLGATSSVDEDRSDYPDAQVARIVLEHLRPLDPVGVQQVSLRKLGTLVRRADATRARAPFAARPPFARSAEGQSLRRYLAAFGIELPPALRTEREQSDVTLATALERLVSEKPRASAVHVWAEPPRKESGVGRALAVLKRKRIDVRWSLPRSKSLGVPDLEALDSESEIDMTRMDEVARKATELTAQVAIQRGVSWLSQHGVRETRVAPKGRG